MSIFDQKEKNVGLFGSGDVGLFGAQNASDAAKEHQPQTPDNKQAMDGGLLKDVPVSIRQKSFGELLSSLKKQLEDDVREFRKKALETFAYDEKIIKARNNYARILQMVKAETQKLDELEENVDFFLQYVRDMEKPTEGDTSAVNIIREVEKLSDEFNSTLQQIRDEDDEVMALVNENMSLIRMIDERLGGETR